MKTALIALLALAAVITGAPLTAGEYHDDTRWVSKSLHSQCNAMGTCSWPYWKKTYHRPRYSRHHFYGRPRQHYRYSRYLHHHRHTYRAYRQLDADVMQAQLRLIGLGYDLEPDGVWGPDTARAIRKFQDRERLEITGELGPRTRAMLLDREVRGRRRRHGDNGHDRYDRSRVAGWRHDDEGDHNDRRCLPNIMRAYSGEHVRKDAEAEAMRHWMAAVRAEHGEIAMDWRHAKNKQVWCWQSSTGERQTEKALEILGQGSHTRCRVEARPCQAPKSEREND